MDGSFTHLGNHFDDGASTIESSSVYEYSNKPNQYEEDDLETVDETLSLASVPIGRSAVGDRNYGEETDGLGGNEGLENEAELPPHASTAGYILLPASSSV
ncbi:hypothetical protein DFH27DRAFT_24156 [Peziza echinospora]|nr:hypothetical protein DFH27DRAFT_24156 [Peziza echinospora]